MAAVIGDLAPIGGMAVAVALYLVDAEVWQILFAKEQVAEHLTHVAWLLLGVRLARLTRAAPRPQATRVWALLGFCVVMVLEETSYLIVYLEWLAPNSGPANVDLASAEALHNSAFGVLAQVLFMLIVVGLAAGAPGLWRLTGKWVPLSRLALATLAVVYFGQFLAEAWLPRSPVAVGMQARPGGAFDEVFDLGLCWAACWAARPSAFTRWLAA